MLLGGRLPQAHQPQPRCLHPKGQLHPSRSQPSRQSSADQRNRHVCNTSGVRPADLASGSTSEGQAHMAEPNAKHGHSTTREILSDPGLEGDPLKFLRASEAYWTVMRKGPHRRGPAVIKTRHRKLGKPDFDVCVCGGTLGLFIALALQLRGHRVCIMEKRLCQGRTQEWNISRQELQVLVRLGLVTGAELERAITSHFNPVRVGFKGGADIWVNDCLNLGVNPKYLLDVLRERFLELGGVIRERTAFRSAEVFTDGVAVKTAANAGAMPITAGDANRPLAVEHEQAQHAQRDTGANGASPGRNGANGAHAPQHSTAAMSSAHASSSGSDNGSGARHSSRSSLRSRQSARTSTSSGAGPRSDPSNGSNGAALAAGHAAEQPAAKHIQQAAGAGAGDDDVVSCRLLVDCMGHWSPIVKQLRGTAKPEGMCLVVGTCADGFPAAKNRTGDLLYTMTDAADDMQLFWEAFPAAGGGRTTYMFTYADADARRPSLEHLLDRYFELLPQYQGVPLSQLKFRRVLFGGFPCFADSPLKPGWDRVVQVGDASASQSPLSFGGFGNMVRHLQRLTDGLDSALRRDQVSKRALGLLQPYQPSLSAAWLFQRSMAFRIGQLRAQRVSSTGRQSSNETGWLPADHVNRLLRCNFRVLRALGDRALRPFLQDTIQWGPLTASMAGMMLSDPVVVCRVLVQVGPGVLAGWFRHYFFLGVYSLLHLLSRPLRSLVKGFWARCLMDAWKWGSGQDYEYHKPEGTPAQEQPQAAMA